MSGFYYFIKGYGSNLLVEYEHQVDNYFFNETQKNNLLNFSHICFYLKAFDFLIPTKLRKLIFLTCYNTKSTHFLYYVFKKYMNILDYSLSPEKQEYNDFLLNIELSDKIVELEKKL